MTATPNGKIVTFYSFKGGTGRTMALANVAWILAANGKKVLVADWDLESPGLHRFFRPFLGSDLGQNSPGVIELVRNFENQAKKRVKPQGWIANAAKVSRHAFPLQWDQFPSGGKIDFLSAGRQNSDYGVVLSGLDWDTFYNDLHGGDFIKALKADLISEYDYTLIDSRTGLSDIADICTAHLPDVLVDCFTFSEQGIEGASRVARTIQELYPHIRILPVPMRIDMAEKDKADAGRALAKRRFADLPDMSPADRAAYWQSVEVPYQAFYAYEETLATFGDIPGTNGSLLSAFEKLTAVITDGQVSRLPAMDEAVRIRERERFRRPLEWTEIRLVYHDQDTVWADWIASLLVSVGIKVGVGDQAESPGPGTRLLTVLSADAPRVTPGHAALAEPLMVNIADNRLLPGVTFENSAFIAGLSHLDATNRILRLVGKPTVTEEPRLGARFPNAAHLAYYAPVKNPRFTGREEALADLRRLLGAQGKTVVLPVAVQGLGGVGKTQLALEYANRYGKAYDVVWWISSEQAQFVDSSLLELGKRLDLNLDPAAVADNVRLVLQSLERGEPTKRWLLVYDNAEDPEDLDKLLPNGGHGHVLITSRNSSWGDRADSVTVDVFRREESVSHLRGRVRTVTDAEATQIAEALGDLPIAVAAAGAFLHETGTKASDYLRQITSEDGAEPPEAVREVWRLSLDRLMTQSPASYRILELCSQLAPEIAFDLIYEEKMARVLSETVPTMTAVLPALVQNLNKFALIKLDSQARQITVHRLLQSVVRQRMTEQARAHARHQVHLILAAARPGDVDEPDNWERFQMLWPHLTVSEAMTCQDEGVRTLLIDRIRFLRQSGEPEEAERIAVAVEQNWQRELAEPGGAANQSLRVQLLQLQFNLAILLRTTARFEQARQLDESVLADQLRILGGQHPHTLMTMGNLASDMRGLGHYAAALQMDEELYPAWLEHFGEDWERTLLASNNLAVSYRLMGRTREALEKDEYTYQRMLVVLGRAHPWTLLSLGNLGRDYRDAGQYAKSVETLQNLYDTIATVRGADRVEAFNAQANLATSLRAAGQATKALELLDVAYDRLLTRLGANHPDTRACRLSRALTLLALGANERAEKAMREIIAAYTEQLTFQHPHTQICLSNLSAIQRANGAGEDAQRSAQQAAAQLGAILSADHPFTIAARMNLAVCLAENGDLAQGAQITEGTLADLVATLGEGHPDTLRCRANLLLMQRPGKSPAADPEIQDVVSRLGDAIGHQRHPSVEALRLGKYAHRIIDPHPY